MIRLAKNGHMRFSLIYKGKTRAPILANQTGRKCKSTLQRGITLHQSERPSSQSVKTRNGRQGVEKREPCYTDGGNVNCLQPLWRSVWRSLKNLKKQSYRAYGTSTPGRISWENQKSTGHKHHKVSAALFTRASTWKQPKCPSKHKMKKEDAVFMYNGILLSHEMKETAPVAATWMDLDLIILSDTSHSGKETYHKISLIRGI